LLANAIGRCCDGTPDPVCLGEETLDDCTTDGGDWYRYRSPLQVLGNSFCECPKYGSGIAPNTGDLGSEGFVRPSDLVCQIGTEVERTAGRNPIYCETPGTDAKFCQKRCVGGDNEGAICQASLPDCAKLGHCSVTTGTVCVVANGDADCPMGETCNADDAGNCQNDICGTNPEGGCAPDFLNIGDDYSLANGSYLRLTQFRYRGGVENPDEDVVFEFWTADNSKLVGAFAFQPNRAGIRDWDIEIDCWPNCNATLGEVPDPSPLIIPPTGIVKMRSSRTIGTINGAAASWSLTDVADIGTNDPAISVEDDVLGDHQAGADVYMFELLGEKVDPPLGACCDDALSCEDTLRWECGVCSQPPGLDPIGTILCASTLHDCPQGGLTQSFCQFNRWFGPISHADFVFGGADLTLCNGISPCDKGACCRQDGTCDVDTADNCTGSDVFLGIATDCEPNCCPQVETGSDCACETKVCRSNLGTCASAADCNGEACTGATPCTSNGDCTSPSTCNLTVGFCRDTGSCAPFLTNKLCDADADCGAQPDFDCVVACTPNPNGPTVLRHPYTCSDALQSEIPTLPPCDPDNGNADCTALQIACTTAFDCPGLETCVCVGGEPCAGNSGFCDASAWTCKQSFNAQYAVTLTGHIPDIDQVFGTADGEACTLNISQDNVGWYELFQLHDPTEGHCTTGGAVCTFDADCGVDGPCVGADTTDDCFDVTAGLCCTDPILSPYWPFFSVYLNCPCVHSEDVDGIAPDFDDANQLKAGFGPNSRANVPCEDGNASMSAKLPPGSYGYQINNGASCAQSTTQCDDDTDCPGTSCVVPNPDYVLHLTVQSCEKAACCLGDTCLVTNVLDCAARGGAYLGVGDNPITACPPQIPNPCALGSCCLNGQCLDDTNHDELGECTGQGGIFVGGITDCALQPCPACPISSPQNCQLVQTVFGNIPVSDRNTDNGAGGATVGVSQLLADDIIFDGTTVDDICWSPRFTAAQGPGFDSTWEVRIYEPDATGAIPGNEICFSTIQVLNKIEGAGQATNTWDYSGRLNTACNHGGTPGVDKFYVEISAFGDSGNPVQLTWSRDQGNQHHAWQSVDAVDGRLGYQLSQVENQDSAFCENDGITTPAPVLGKCCSCPGICNDGLTMTECLDDFSGVFVAGDTCANACPDVPPNDDCVNATPVSGLLDDGTELLIETENLCATDDGPPLDATFGGGCRSSVTGTSSDAELHDDIWYAYTAEHCGTLYIHSCNDADNDQMISIYDASGGCPVTTANEIGCNDDGCTGSGAAGPSEIEIDVVQDQEILVRVGGWNNEVPGGFRGDPRGFMTLHWSYIATCPSVLPPTLPQTAPHNILKNRYISVVPANGALPHYLRLDLVSTQVNGAPIGGSYWAHQPDANCISQVDAHKPGAPPTWNSCSVVHLAGCPILPTSTYDIFAESGAGEISATALTANTQALPGGSKFYGDCVGSFSPIDDAWTPPDGLVSINDAVAAIKTFQNPGNTTGCATPPCNATHVSVTDVHPAGFAAQPWGVPNQAVDINDVFAIILGFQGKEFPGPQIGSCP
jgi:hypothetical protein